MKTLPFRHVLTRASSSLRTVAATCLIAALSVFATAALAQSTEPATPPPTEVTPAPSEAITVATKIAPPFAMQADNGEWTGLAIALVESIAQDLKRDIVWQKSDTSDGLIDAVASGKADMAASAVSITGEREKVVDFSYAYYDSGLAIAVQSDRGSGVWDVLRALASPAFLTTISMLLGLLFVVGFIIWLVERRGNAEQFPEKPVDGIGNGFWWSAVTMTTVGYGDKAPVTPLGRAIAVIWMFAALILTAVFTAQLTTALTLESISGPVSSAKDLPNARVGIVSQSATTDYFQQRLIRTRGFDTVEDGLKALAKGEIDAFVHDEPILRYVARREFPGRVRMIEQVFEPQAYGIVLAQGNPLREPVNQALLRLRETNRWTNIRERYLGEQP